MRMGVNYISNLYKSAFEAWGINTKSEKISVTSYRKNLVQAGADSLVPATFLSKMLGQKNLDSKLDKTICF